MVAWKRAASARLVAGILVVTLVVYRCREGGSARRVVVAPEARSDFTSGVDLTVAHTFLAKVDRKFNCCTHAESDAEPTWRGTEMCNASDSTTAVHDAMHSSAVVQSSNRNSGTHMQQLAASMTHNFAITRAGVETSAVQVQV